VTTAKPTAAPASPSLGSQTEPGQFATEDQAKASCGGDTIVWANLPTKVYHFSGTRYYGTTKRGAYMCEKQTIAQGMRAGKNETHP
jgi:hypothetical protein